MSDAECLASVQAIKLLLSGDILIPGWECI
jgi:hypothetical protein